MNIVRDEFYRSYPAEGDEKARYAARQKAFRRAVTNTQDKDLIGVREVEGRTFLWLESPGTDPGTSQPQISGQDTAARVYVAGGRSTCKASHYE